MQLQHYLSIVRRRLWLLLIGPICAGIIGALVVAESVPVYEATATLLVVQGPANREMPSMDSFLTSERLAKTYIELLRTRPVLEQVRDHLGLQLSLEALGRKIRIEAIRDTQLMQVTAQDANPQLAADIANETVTVFNALEASLLANPYATLREGLHIVEAAEAPPLPIRPRPLRDVALAVVVGLMLSLTAIFLLELLNDKVEELDQIKQVTGLSPLASIPRIRGAHAADKLVMAEADQTPNAEAYRALRVALQFASVDNPPRSFLITSSGAGEGKSTTAANLAAAFALTGKRVILIDTDLRRPTLHTFFQQSSERGVTTALFAPPGDAENHLVATQLPQLRLLPSGPRPPNPAELLGSLRMKELVHELSRAADVLIMDSPPALVAVDAIALAQLCDATVLVAAARATRAASLRKVTELLARSGVRMTGVVLNRARFANENYSAYYGHSEERSRSIFRWRRKKGLVDTEASVVISHAAEPPQLTVIPGEKLKSKRTG